jgi:3-carboxy-cis,cis-muconate cycloisomerase
LGQSIVFRSRGLDVPTTLDCELFRDLFGSAEMRGLFDTRSMVQGWLDAEAALAAAEAEVGVIPSSAAQRIRAEARVELYDLEALRHGIAESQHPLVPLIRALADRCGDAGAYVHWGATTQDIMDTAMVLQVRAALPRLLDRVLAARCSCARLAGEYAASPMAARTHGQQAVPTTFGLKAAGWADELSRVAERLAGALATISVAQLGGAGGTLASLGADAGAVLDAFCAALELRRADVPWFAARDRIRDLAHALGEFGAAAERIAAELIRLQATEVGELAEGAGEAHVGSSTMPQKQNPMMSEYLVASTRLLRGAIDALANAVAHAGERDMALWAVEWLALPQAFILAGGAAEKLERLVADLEVDDARMRANLNLAGGAIMAEAAMMALAEVVGHEEAHAIVTAASRQARVEQRQMLDVLAEQPQAARILDAALLKRLRDPRSYLGWSVELAADASTWDGAAPIHPDSDWSNNG